MNHLSALKWIYRNLPVPPSLWRRETEEFDLLHGLNGHALPPPPASAAPSAQPAPVTPSATWSLVTSSSSSSSSSWISAGASSPRTPTSQAREVAVDADGFQLYDPAAFKSAVAREDFVPNEVLETVTSVVQARSADEVQADAKHRRSEQDIDALLLDQGLEQNRRHREQEAGASSSKGKPVVVYVDEE